jgi:hypothetical protein
MENIAISELRSTGSELLVDSESFLDELSENELTFTKGASSGACIATVTIAATIGLSVGATIGGVSGYTANKKR